MEVEPQIIEKYVASGQVKIVYRHLLQLGQDSERAAEASECAGEQGKFWEMRSALYNGQGDLFSSGSLDGALAVFAKDLVADEPAFQACLQNGTFRDAVNADFRTAQSEGVQSRPVFDINGTRVVGSQPLASFVSVIDAALAQ